MKSQHKFFLVVFALLVSVVCMGSKCNSDPNSADNAISMVREILLDNDAVINEIDDMLVANYDASDEGFERLERGVCVLETMQKANEMAWSSVRVLELASHDHARRTAAGETPIGDVLNDATTRVTDYLVEVLGVALLAYDMFKQWGKKAPKKMDNMIDMLKNFLGKSVPVRVLDCSEVLNG